MYNLNIIKDFKKKNYSTCLCKIINEDDNIDLLKELNKKINNNDWVEKTME